MDAQERRLHGRSVCPERAGARRDAYQSWYERDITQYGRAGAAYMDVVYAACVGNTQAAHVQDVRYAAGAWMHRTPIWI
jgi:hypothetical protein